MRALTGAHPERRPIRGACKVSCRFIWRICHAELRLLAVLPFDDRLRPPASLARQARGPRDNGQTYPPYNIERTGENAYRITLAVAGFADNELTVETRENTLTVRGGKDARRRGRDKREMLYRASRRAPSSAVSTSPTM